MKRFLIINGPNLNMLGKREPSIYGTKSLYDVNADLTQIAHDYHVKLDHFQSNQCVW